MLPGDGILGDGRVRETGKTELMRLSGLSPPRGCGRPTVPSCTDRLFQRTGSAIIRMIFAGIPSANARCPSRRRTRLMAVVGPFRKPTFLNERREPDTPLAVQSHFAWFSRAA